MNCIHGQHISYEPEFLPYFNSPETVIFPQNVTKSYNVINNDKNFLLRDKEINIYNSKSGRSVYSMWLIQKNYLIAKQLKKADEKAKGSAPEKGIFSDEQLMLLELMDREKMEFSPVRDKYGYSVIEKLKNLGLIEQEIDSKAYPQKSLVKITEKGKKVGENLKEIEKSLGVKISD